MLGLAQLFALLARVKLLKLLLETECKAQQVTVVSLELADYIVIFENASCLVGLDECAQLLIALGFRLDLLLLLDHL